MESPAAGVLYSPGLTIPGESALRRDELKGKKALVMGLGLHGGGLQSILYLLSRGAEVSCTDLRTADILAESLEALEGQPVRFILGEHRMQDFDEADIIVKNPAVPSDSEWISGRDNVETDISLFLKSTDAPVIAVTGSKGKSTVVSALQHILKQTDPGVRLGGNITVSPLSFLDELGPDSPVILELSSWQLADLKGRNLLNPRIACITNLMHDHQNRYESFADYEADKMVIFESMPDDGVTVFPDDGFGTKWAASASGTSILVGRPGSPGASGTPGAWLDDEGRGWFGSAGEKEPILPEDLQVPGTPFRTNLLFAAAIARIWGCSPEVILDAVGSFRGVPYRMELFLEANNITFYDDTAATIPDACAAAVRSMARPVILLAGGTDKELDFSPFEELASLPKKTILLQGSATDAIMPILDARGAVYEGPFGSMEKAVAAALETAEPGDAVLLSPGAASFGLFRHEFERGDAFKEACRRMTELR